MLTLLNLSYDKKRPLLGTLTVKYCTPSTDPEFLPLDDANDP